VPVGGEFRKSLSGTNVLHRIENFALAKEEEHDEGEEDEDNRKAQYDLPCFFYSASS
jgi:hypothetical protein